MRARSIRRTAPAGVSGPGEGRDIVWVESLFDVAGVQVCASVKRLDDETERVAAQLAWFGEALVRPDVNLEALGWTACLRRIMGEWVTLRVRDDQIRNLEATWDLVVLRVLEAFVRVNELDHALKKYLGAGFSRLS